MSDTTSRREQPPVILIVDKPSITSLMQLLLQLQGYVAHTASSPEEAEVVIRNNPPDLIILDPFLPGRIPGMSGFEFCQDLKSNPLTELIPVIMIAGLDDLEFKVKGIEAGADDFLSKPVSGQELFAVLKTQLNRKRAMDRRLLSMQKSAPDHESHLR